MLLLVISNRDYANSLIWLTNDIINMVEKCIFCENPATLTCNCRIPLTLLCNNHAETHRSNNFFTHNLQPYPFIVRPECKATLLNKLTELININQEQQTRLFQSSEVQLGKISNFLNELCENLGEIVQEHIRTLKIHENELIKLKSEVESFSSVKLNEYLTPLEKSLLDSDFLNSLIKTISPDRVEFKDFKSQDYLELIPSNVFTLLSGYNYMVNIEKEGIQVVDNEKKMKNFGSNGIENASFLKVSEDALIITGGDDSEKLSFEFNIKTDSFTNLPLLNVPRKCHSMAWIDGYPAVLGGKCIDGNPLSSVEILKGNSWIAQPNLKLKHARENFTAFNHFNQVFVAGGAECYLEVYKDGIWNCFNLNMSGLLWGGRIPAIYGYGRLIVFGNNLRFLKLHFDSLTGEIDEGEEIKGRNFSCGFKVKAGKVQFIQDHKIVSTNIILN